MNSILLASELTWWRQLLWLVGFDDLADAPPGADLRFEFTNLPTSWGVFVLIAIVAVIVYGVYFLYRREQDTCAVWVKLVLATLRAAVLLLLALIFLGPALIHVENRTQHPPLVLARDASLSMNTADRYSDDAAAKTAAAALGQSVEELRKNRPTRAAIVNQLLAREQGKTLAELSQKGTLTVFDFAERPTKLQTRGALDQKPAGELNAKPAEKTNAKPAEKTNAKPALELPPLAATGRGTDLFQMIREAVSTSPAAALLFTDGQHTGHDDPAAAAREAKEKGAPLFIVGVGDPSRPRNLKVANVYVRPQVWQEEPFEIDAMITAQGVESTELTVRLFEQKVNDSDMGVGEPKPVGAALRLPVPAGGGRLAAQFSHTLSENGRFIYQVKVDEVDDEISTADNAASSTVVKVLSREKVHVLLVAGAPTWEYRLVQKLLSRDKTMIVSCWLQTLDEERAQEGARQITRLPATKEELFYYDVVLLFDPDPQELDKEWAELLKKFVEEHAGGLLFMAGPKYSGRLLNLERTKALQDVLPVFFGDISALEVTNLLTTNQRAHPLKVVHANVDHPIMRFYSDRQETLRRWETLPGIFWSFPSREPKPTSTVLLEHSDPSLLAAEGARPLMVAGRAGAGHTLYLGFNGTWRWRRVGRQAEFFDKFWIQAVRYLVEGRALEGRRRGYVQAERDRYEIGDKINVTARLQDAAYNPLDLPQVEATLTVGSEAPETVVLTPIKDPQGKNSTGGYQASLAARRVGVHNLRISLPGVTSDGVGSQAAVIETPFTVELPSVETNQVWLDKPRLIDLANLSGGKYFDIDQLDQVAAQIPDKTTLIEIRAKPRPLWDVRGMLFALIGLLCMEWFIRKQNKLL